MTLDRPLLPRVEEHAYGPRLRGLARPNRGPSLRVIGEALASITVDRCIAPRPRQRRPAAFQDWGRTNGPAKGCQEMLPTEHLAGKWLLIESVVAYTDLNLEATDSRTAATSTGPTPPSSRRLGSLFGQNT